MADTVTVATEDAMEVGEAPAKPARTANYNLDPIVKRNEKLVAYYKAQPVIPPSEFDAFFETLKIDLPSSFRIQMCLP